MFALSASQSGSYLSGRSCPSARPSARRIYRLSSRLHFIPRSSTHARVFPPRVIRVASWARLQECRGPQTHLYFITGPRSEPEPEFCSSGTGHTWAGERSSQRQPKRHVTVSDWSAADGLRRLLDFQSSRTRSCVCEILGKKGVSQEEKSDFRLVILNLTDQL